MADPAVVSETALVIRYLRDNPSEFEILLTLARLAYAEERETPYSDNPPARQRAEAFLASTRFGHCASCLFPLVLLPDFRELDWPTYAEHRCSMSFSQPGRVTTITKGFE